MLRYGACRKRLTDQSERPVAFETFQWLPCKEAQLKEMQTATIPTNDLLSTREHVVVSNFGCVDDTLVFAMGTTTYYLLKLVEPKTCSMQSSRAAVEPSALP